MSDEKHNVTVSPPDTTSLPALPPPIKREKSKPFNPLDGIDFEKIESKQQAYLMGFINGQLMGGRR